MSSIKALGTTLTRAGSGLIGNLKNPRMTGTAGTVETSSHANTDGFKTFIADGNREVSLDFDVNIDLRSHYCVTFDGTDDVITIGDTSLDISAISFWVKLASDNQQIMSLNDGSSDNDILVAAGVLGTGGFNTIKIDGVSKSAAQAGVILNDNAWHFVELSGSTVDAASVTLGKVNGSNYGAIRLADLRLYEATTNRLAAWFKLGEGTGTTVYDNITGDTGAITGATAGQAWANAQYNFGNHLLVKSDFDNGTQTEYVIGLNGGTQTVTLPACVVSNFSVDMSGGVLTGSITLKPSGQAVWADAV